MYECNCCDYPGNSVSRLADGTYRCSGCGTVMDPSEYEEKDMGDDYDYEDDYGWDDDYDDYEDDWDYDDDDDDLDY